MPNTKPLMTKRDWLATQKGPDGKPLAIPGARGRFSHAANAALLEAEAKGMKWAEPEVKPAKPKTEKAEKTVKIDTPKAPKVEGEYDAKDVRAWATQTGMTVSERGRIPAEVVNAYLAANGSTPKKKSVMTVHIDKPKVRPETVAFGYARRKPEDGPHITEPLIHFSKCGRCSAHIQYCECKPGPFAPAWMGNGKSEVALLHKPA